MRPIGWGLAVALFAAVLAPVAVMSAPKAAAPAVSPEQKKQGMADAPALVQAAGLPCQVSDARFIGKQEDKKAKTSTTFYEVACGQSMGFILQAPQGGTTTAFTCIEADTPTPDGKAPSLPCILAGNSDPKAQLAPLLAKGGAPTCVPEKARGIGQSKSNTFIEVACQGGAGYVLVASSPLDASKEAEAQNCLNFDEGTGNIKCTLSDKSVRLAVVDRYAKAGSPTCVVKDRRYIAATKDNFTFFEASCQDGKGYFYKVDSKDNVVQTLDCAKVQGMLGGCQLTDSREAATEQAGLYTKLAKNAGSTCDVAKYASFPNRGNEEVVELSCKDGSSVIGIFPGSGKGQVFDCGRALAAGYKCSLGKPDAGYAALTSDLKKYAPTTTCVVSNSRLAAKTAKGTVLVEVACADKYKGYMIEYQTTPTVSAVAATGCTFTGSCKLPGNT
jgi:hypothetical protein